MRCWLANRNNAETELVLRGRTTTSGLWVANHLSPACFSRTEVSKLTSSLGRMRLRRGRWLILAAVLEIEHITPPGESSQGPSGGGPPGRHSFASPASSPGTWTTILPHALPYPAR